MVTTGQQNGPTNANMHSANMEWVGFLLTKNKQMKQWPIDLGAQRPSLKALTQLSRSGDTGLYVGHNPLWITRLRPNPNQTDLTAQMWRHSERERERERFRISAWQAAWVGPAAEDRENIWIQKGIMSDYVEPPQCLSSSCTLGFHMWEK